MVSAVPEFQCEAHLFVVLDNVFQVQNSFLATNTLKVEHGF